MLRVKLGRMTDRVSEPMDISLLAMRGNANSAHWGSIVKPILRLVTSRENSRYRYCFLLRSYFTGSFKLYRWARFPFQDRYKRAERGGSTRLSVAEEIRGKRSWKMIDAKFL